MMIQLCEGRISSILDYSLDVFATTVAESVLVMHNLGNVVVNDFKFLLMVKQ